MTPAGTTAAFLLARVRRRGTMFATDCIHENQPMLDRRMTAVLHDCRAAARDRELE